MQTNFTDKVFCDQYKSQFVFSSEWLHDQMVAFQNSNPPTADRLPRTAWQLLKECWLRALKPHTCIIFDETNERGTLVKSLVAMHPTKGLIHINEGGKAFISFIMKEAKKIAIELANFDTVFTEYMMKSYDENVWSKMLPTMEVSLQGTSSASYEKKNTAKTVGSDSCTMKADYMSCSGLSNVASAASSAAKAIGDLGSITLNTADLIGHPIDWNSVSDHTICIDDTYGQWSNVGTAICDRLDEYCKKSECPLNDKSETVKENKSMNMAFNFDFGPVTGDSIRMSMYGIAVKNPNNTYVAYDAKNHSVMDVEVLNIPSDGMMYKMPVALKDVKVGDVVIHNRTPMYVSAVNANTLSVVDIRNASAAEIYPVKNMFGFNFVTKVVSLVDMTNSGATADTPFGNMLPFLMMNGNKDIDPMMLMLMCGNGKFDMSNPMTMYAMMNMRGNNTKTDPMLMMLLMNQMNQTAPVAPVHTENCGCGQKE